MVTFLFTIVPIDMYISLHLVLEFAFGLHSGN